MIVTLGILGLKLVKYFIKNRLKLLLIQIVFKR